MFQFFAGNKKTEIWKKVLPADAESLKNFLIENERHSVPFSSRLINAEGIFDERIIERSAIFIETRDSRTAGAVLLTQDGIICPVFTQESNIRALEGICGDRLFNRKRYLTIMGSSSDVKSVEKLYPQRKRFSVDYHLMSAESSSVPDIIDSYLNSKSEKPEQPVLVGRASEEDLDSLMPLRKAYEIEEVVLNPRNFNELSCRNRFRKTIIDDAAFFASVKGRPVATCCINADGLEWSQIGGVFTLPRYRSMGIAARVMKILAEYSSFRGKNLTLFVKKANGAAIRLYENCGFKKNGEYRISYLESR